MSTRKPLPHLVAADDQGRIFDHPDLLMTCRRAGTVDIPREEELIPVPQGSDFFLLPGRSPLGFDEKQNVFEATEGQAVAVFVTPGYTLSAVAACVASDSAPVLPLYAYGAVGYRNGRFYVCAAQVDTDPRQIFPPHLDQPIRRGAADMLARFPQNRLVQHLTHCALTYCCPAARNLMLGRFEAPLPTSRACNASCVGCISMQSADSGFPSTQHRIAFRPTPAEISQVMSWHASRAKQPILSFGQGCEGEPLTEATTISKAISLFRSEKGRGTVNINTNGSLPDTLPGLRRTGLDSLRISMNSADPGRYSAYYRPGTYTFSDVGRSAEIAKAEGVFVYLNLLYFPGVTDSEGEMDALCGFIERTGADCIQLRNLNLDPDVYLRIVQPSGPSVGLKNFMRRMRRNFPRLRFAYFNPYLEQTGQESP